MKNTIIAVIVVIAVIIVAILIFSPKPPTDIDSATVIDRGPHGHTEEELNDGHGHSDDMEESDTDVSKNTPVNVPNSALDFSFVGFGPGKSHVGTFEEYEIKDVFVNDNGIPISGKIVFAVDSVKTDSSVLDGHLCEKENFFDCVNYKEITFVADDVVSSDGVNYDVTGSLTLKNNVKTITFPVIISDGKVTADFKVSMDDLGFSAPGIVNDQVQIKFTGTL